MAKFKPDNSSEIRYLDGYEDALTHIDSLIEDALENGWEEKVILKILVSVISELKEATEEKKLSLD